MCDVQGEAEKRLCEEVPLSRLQFKILICLYPGRNTLAFDFLGVKVRYRQPIFFLLKLALFLLFAFSTKKIRKNIILCWRLESH